MPSPLALAATAVSDATGQATFKFDPVPRGSIYTGTLFCQGAPAGAFFAPTLAGTPFPPWNGPGPAGPVQGWSGMPLVITAVGLIPSTPYAIQWQGSVASTAEEVELTGPTLGQAAIASTIVNSVAQPVPVSPGALILGPFAVGGPSIACRFQALTNPVLIEFLWKAVDPVSGALFTCFDESIGVAVGSPGTAQMIFPAKGSLLQLRCTSASGATLSTTIVAVPAQGREWSWFNEGALIDQQNVAVLAGATLTVDAPFTFPGPVVWGVITNQNWTGQLFWRDGTANTHQIKQVANGDPNVGLEWTSEVIHLPPFPAQIKITNNGGVTSAVFTTLIADLR